MTTWYYTKARNLSDGKFLGWVGSTISGWLEFLGSENEDPAKINRVLAVGLFESDGEQYLRAPAYHEHGSASLGGAETNGYRAVWKWGETRGYPVKIDGRGILHDGNGRVLSLFVDPVSMNDASWEAGEKTAVTLEFFKPA